MKRILFCIFIFQFQNGCQDNPVAHPNNPILGNWNWVKSYTLGSYITPATEHYAYRIAFTSDGNFYGYKNDTLVFSTPVTVAVESVYHYSTATVVTYLKSNNKSIIERLDSDTLVLSDYAADGFVNTYNRIK